MNQYHFKMTKIKKYIDKKTKAKIRIFTFSIPRCFFVVMLEMAKNKGLSDFENNKSYIKFLNIKSKYYNLISIEKNEIDFVVELNFIFEKLTNKKSLYK